MRRAHIFWTILIATALGAAAAGQPPAPAQRPTFRAGVDVVTVDATVIDSDGSPVAGLTAEDFVIEVDGKPRPIVSAQFVGSSTASEGGGPPPAIRDVSTNDVDLSGRIVILAIDRGNIRQGEGRAALADVGRLLDGLSPHDRVGLVTFPDGGPRVPITNDREAIRQAIRGIRGVEERQFDPLLTITISEAFEIERSRPAVPGPVLDRNCQGAGSVLAGDPASLDFCRTRIVAEAVRLVNETRQRIDDTVTRLSALLESLRYVEGPKSVVFVSEGLASDRALRSRLQQFSSAVAATGTSFYAVQIYVPPITAAMSGLNADWDDDRRLRADGLSLVADVSGGALFRPAAGLAPTFDRIARELSARYVLAFQVTPQDRDGKTHRIAVALKDRRGRLVRHRTEFTAQSAPTSLVRRVETLEGAMSEPLPLPGLPLRLATYVVPDSGTAFKILVACEIGAPDQAAAARARVMFDVFDANGQRVGKANEAIEVAPQAGAAALRFVTSFSAPAGRYSLKLAAKDDAGRLGSVDHPFVVEPAGTPDVTVSSLMLYRAVDAGAVARPELIFDLARAEPMFAARLMARATSAGSLDAISAVLEVTDGREITRFNSTMAAVDGAAPGQRDFELRVPIARWPAGNYVVKAKVLKGDQPVAVLTRTLALRDGPAPATTTTTATTAAATEGRWTPGGLAGTATVGDVVARASRYVGDYAQRATSVVAEERYVQAILDMIAGNTPTVWNELMAWRDEGARRLSPGVVARRQLLSDLLMVKTSSGWYTNYRDVAEVDGKSVKNREERALALFASNRSDVGATLRRVAEEGTRYNLGRIRRTVNIPTLALFTLHPDHARRFAFEAGGEDTVDGVRVLVLRFREREGPTFIMTSAGRPVFAEGRIWVVPESGAVVRTELEIVQPDVERRVKLGVQYAHAAAVDLLMPKLMNEWYIPTRTDRTNRIQVLTGQAEYSNFREFKVTTTEGPTR